MSRILVVVSTAAALGVLAACEGGSAPARPDGTAAASGTAATGGTAGAGARELVERGRIEAEIDSALHRLSVLADSVDALFRPVPLLTPGQEATFRRFGNDAQLARARALGVRASDAAGRAAALREGRLVRLEDSTPLWVVRELAHSEPLVTPDARALLAEAARRFQQRLGRMGVPAYRLEVTSALRTAESQSALRATNPNAAAGQSTHEYGTTLDVAYASFAAPDSIDYGAPAGGMAWLGARLEPVAAAVLESVAARNSRELQAILGLVMAELQAEGLAMVTLERQQPVYHFTVARRIEAREATGDE
jgi:hypothetical protein